MHPAAWMIAIGSAEPPAMPAEGVEDVEVVEVVEAGMSDALTVIVPPSDSRNAITAQICWGERVRVMSGMIGSYPWTTKARGCVSDSYRYALQSFPDSRLPQRAPIGPWPFSSVSKLGARVPKPWHVVHPPMPVKPCSPAWTSCSGVTSAPSVRAWGTSDCTCGLS